MFDTLNYVLVRNLDLSGGGVLLSATLCLTMD